MKITGLKATVAKVFTVGLLVGAAALATPSRAEAQVSFGVRLGGPVYAPAYRRPVYVAPVPAYGYYRPGFYGGYGWDRREAFVRREERERFDHFHHVEGWGR